MLAAPAARRWPRQPSLTHFLGIFPPFFRVWVAQGRLSVSCWASPRCSEHPVMSKTSLAVMGLSPPRRGSNYCVELRCDVRRAAGMGMERTWYWRRRCPRGSLGPGWFPYRAACSSVLFCKAPSSACLPPALLCCVMPANRVTKGGRSTMVTAGLGFGCLHMKNITQYWVTPLAHMDVAWIIWAIPGTTLTSPVRASVSQVWNGLSSAYSPPAPISDLCLKGSSLCYMATWLWPDGADSVACHPRLQNVPCACFRIFTSLCMPPVQHPAPCSWAEPGAQIWTSTAAHFTGMWGCVGLTPVAWEQCPHCQLSELAWHRTQRSADRWKMIPCTTAVSSAEKDDLLPGQLLPPG